MKWPELVPDSVCTIPVKIQFEDGINEDGSPKKAVLFEGNCNYSENSKQVLDQERRLVQLQTTALFNGDNSRLFEFFREPENPCTPKYTRIFRTPKETSKIHQILAVKRQR